MRNSNLLSQRRKKQFLPQFYLKNRYWKGGVPVVNLLPNDVIMQFYLCIVETQCINAECYEESKSFIMTQQKKNFVADFCEKPLFLGFATIT